MNLFIALISTNDLSQARVLLPMLSAKMRSHKEKVFFIWSTFSFLFSRRYLFPYINKTLVCMCVSLDSDCCFHISSVHVCFIFPYNFVPWFKCSIYFHLEHGERINFMYPVLNLINFLTNCFQFVSINLCLFYGPRTYCH